MHINRGLQQSMLAVRPTCHFAAVLQIALQHAVLALPAVQVGLLEVPWLYRYLQHWEDQYKLCMQRQNVGSHLLLGKG